MFPVKQSDNELSEQGVLRDARQCTHCGAEPRLPGQRWGAHCRKLYMRQWRAEQRAKRDADREFVRTTMTITDYLKKFTRKRAWRDGQTKDEGREGC